MTTATMTKRKKGFHLPIYTPAKRSNDKRNGVLSHIVMSMASDERIEEATPSLKRLYEFLRSPKP